MKNLLTLIVFFLLINTACAQVKNQDGPPAPPAPNSSKIAESKINKGVSLNRKEAIESLKNQAKEMGEAILKKDFETYVNFTYTPFVRGAGGREKWIEIQKNSVEQAEKDGFKITRFDVSEPTKISGICDAFTFALLPAKVAVESPDAITEIKTTFFSVSENCGKNWQFIDLQDVPKQTFEQMITSDWKYPEKEAPKVYKKQQ